MTPPDLAPILRELDHVAARGEHVDLWWRDDDAVRETHQLDRLLRLSESSGCPLAIAAIPALVEPSLIERLAGERAIRVLPHGLRHENHAAPVVKAAEFGPDRPLAILMDEAAKAHDLIADSFGPLSLPVFVPPWNRIAPALAAALPRLGYAGLSTFAGASGHAGRIDTHLDPVDWHGARGLLPLARLAAPLTAALDRGERTIGLLTHHLAFDAELWTFTEGLLSALADHPAVRFADLADLVTEPAHAHHGGGPLHRLDAAQELAG